MKTGMLTAGIFPVLGVILLLMMRAYFRKNKVKFDRVILENTQ